MTSEEAWKWSKYLSIVQLAVNKQDFW
jgi:hypothetical protein